MRTETTDAFVRVVLERRGVRAVVIPELGGKIEELEIGGRQWLWTSDALPLRTPIPGTSYVETADTGGYDECFPTVGPCTFEGAALQDHGELWSQPAALDRNDRSVTCSWRARSVPALFSRTTSIEDDGSVRMTYRVKNEQAKRVPFLWSAHPLLPLTDDTALDLPRARMRVFAAHNLAVADGDGVWPNLVLADGRVVDLTKPTSIASSFALKVFLDLGERDGHVAIRQGGARLACDFDPREVTHFGLWLNRRGWTPFAKGTPYVNLAFEPCIGAPDPLSDAVSTWKSAAWLEPNATRTWSLTWRASR